MFKAHFLAAGLASMALTGCVSVTPLHLDLTNFRLLEEIRGWDLKL